MTASMRIAVSNFCDMNHPCVSQLLSKFIAGCRDLSSSWKQTLPVLSKGASADLNDHRAC